MTNRAPRNPSGLEAFERSMFPLRPEESSMTLLETQTGLHQILVDGVAKTISEKTARKLRDDLIKVYGPE